MGIEFSDRTAKFVGEVSAEEAESFLQFLLEKAVEKESASAVQLDLEECKHVHGAVLQVLLKARPPVTKWPRDEDLRNWLRSALKAEN